MAKKNSPTGEQQATDAYMNQLAAQSASGTSVPKAKPARTPAVVEDNGTVAAEPAPTPKSQPARSGRSAQASTPSSAASLQEQAAKACAKTLGSPMSDKEDAVLVIANGLFKSRDHFQNSETRKAFCLELLANGHLPPHPGTGDKKVLTKWNAQAIALLNTVRLAMDCKFTFMEQQGLADMDWEPSDLEDESNVES